MSIGYWLIVLVIVMLIFGTKRLRDVRAELSVALRGFKDEMRDREPGLDRPRHSRCVSCRKSHPARSNSVECSP